MRSNKVWTRWTTLLYAVALVTGCASPPGSGNYCDIAMPIWWDSTEDLDATPDAVVRQIVEHNETVAGLCGGGLSGLK